MTKSLLPYIEIYDRNTGFNLQKNVKIRVEKFAKENRVLEKNEVKIILDFTTLPERKLENNKTDLIVLSKKKMIHVVSVVLILEVKHGREK